MTRLAAIGFDANFVITTERHNPVREENELLSRFPFPFHARKIVAFHDA